MELKSLMSSKELKHSALIVFILTIVFGFNDGGDSFVVGFWLKNLFSIMVLVIITVLAHMIGAKLAAISLGQEAELRIISLRGVKLNLLGTRLDEKFNLNLFGFKFKSIPFSTFVAFFLTVISYGTFYFTAVSTIIVNKIPRLGKGFELDESREALIYFWALVANLVLVVLFNYLHIEKGVMMGTYFILWNLLPVHGLLGSKIFFNNKLLYIFFLAFTLLFLSFFTKINVVLLVVLSILIAFFVALYWFFKTEYKP